MKKVFFVGVLAIVAILGARFLPFERVTKTRNPIEAPKEPILSLLPETVLQGEPGMLIVEHIGTSTVESLTLEGKKLGVFMYDDKPSALIGIDLKKTPGTYPVVAKLSDGRTLIRDLVVSERAITTAPLGIPDSFGGNTSEGEAALNAALARENALLGNIETSPEALWSGKFEYPIDNPITTDIYGYSRLTGASTISHKGTDFRAEVGTPIYAMNSGVVRISRQFIAYGNTVVIDHGQGVQTLYMHLSEVSIKEGDWVEKRQMIGRSGDTGYVQGPHLHLSIKIGGVSIDPEAFLKLF